MGWGVEQGESAPRSTDPTPRTAAGAATAPVLPTYFPMVPGEVAPTIARGRAWGGDLPLGFAHRGRGVAREMGNIGWRPGFAHRERGVVVQRGFGSFTLDSHYLSSSGSSSWVPGTRFSNSPFVTLIISSTLGIEMRLLFEVWIGQLVCVSDTTRPGDLRDSCLLSCLQRFVSIISEYFCPGERELVESLTIGLREYGPSPAQFGNWIGGPRALGFICVRIERPPLGVPVSLHIGKLWSILSVRFS